jgi:hypothetical protein
MLSLGVCALAVWGCERKPTQDASQTKPAATAAAADCASSEAFGKLKQIVFDDAAKAAPDSQRIAIQNLAAQSTASVKLAVLDSVDQQTAKISCSGQLTVTFPQTASSAFGGAAPAMTNVRYTSQPAADGTGQVISVEGAGPIIDSIARADLSAWVARSTQADVVASRASPVPSSPVTRAASPPFNPIAAIRNNPALGRRMEHLNAMLTNATERDVTGDVKAAHAAALRELYGCADNRCIDAWFARREAALSKWQD